MRSKLYIARYLLGSIPYYLTTGGYNGCAYRIDRRRLRALRCSSRKEIERCLQVFIDALDSANVCANRDVYSIVVEDVLYI